MKDKRANTIEMYQRVQGEITWDQYLRLRHFIKNNKGKKIQDFIGEAIVEKLDREEGNGK